MRNLLLSILSIVMLNSCSKDRLTANGDRITETRTLNEFTGVLVSGANRVNLNYGNEYKVVLKTFDPINTLDLSVSGSGKLIKLN